MGNVINVVHWFRCYLSKDHGTPRLLVKPRYPVARVRVRFASAARQLVSAPFVAHKRADSRAFASITRDSLAEEPRTLPSRRGESYTANGVPKSPH
jgi:hypothetical protein